MSFVTENRHPCRMGKRGEAMEEITRRAFMRKGTVFVGGALGTAALGLSPRYAAAGKPRLVESHCGLPDAGRPKVLLAYGSMHGSTADVAESVALTLCSAGMSAEVHRVEEVKRVSGYDAVIVGSAVRSGRWLPEVVDFVQSYRDVLAERPVAYFLTCLTLYRETPETRRRVREYLRPVLDAVPKVSPVGLGLFAGVLDYARYNFVVRMIMKGKMEKQGVPEGDHRDWDGIRAWARGLSPRLAGSPAGTRLSASGRPRGTG